MESTFFPSKSSFAVFVWLTISIVSVMSFGSPDKLFAALTSSVNHSLTRLLQIQDEVLPAIADSFAKIAAAIGTTNVISTAAANEANIDGSIDVPFKPIEAPIMPEAKLITKIIPKDDLQCMADNIYYEAGSQSYAGKIAVGLVVLNRLKSPSYPRTICGVIYEGSVNPQTSICQFSWTCQKRLPVAKNSDNWMQSLRAAKELLSNRGKTIDIVDGATSFHASTVKPVWAKKLKFVAQIDGHLFYTSK